MNTLIKSTEAEFRRYKALAEGAMKQVPEDRLSAKGPGGGNSLAILGWHISENLRSRFSDFLASDGEKEWRDREGEFAARAVSREALMAKWDEGWTVLLGTLAGLQDEDLTKTITIRKQPMAVHEALNRSLAHISYHVGQIVYVAHSLVGAEWTYLSIPPGGTAAYNANPTMERAQAFVKAATGK